MEKGQDLWLERWLPLLLAEAAPKPVLELGCDTGRDTGWLLRHGLSVVATDIALEALRKARQAAPGALLLQHDLRTPLPFMSASFNVVVASLSLHYFDSDTTANRGTSGSRLAMRSASGSSVRAMSSGSFRHATGMR
ncbi:class I SAM-dependent methyltransferase [Ramlibacter sp.]|uniref:class I SAM-dependent methyltransferase n=1 Tax=Ramlibacter sp. TaxID=1917967 RepID=UPI002FCBF7DA